MKNDGVTGSTWLRTGIDAAECVSVAGHTEVGARANGPDYAVHRFSTTGVCLNEIGEVGSAEELADGLAAMADGAVLATGHGLYDGLRHPRTISLDATWTMRWNSVYSFQEQDVCEGLALGNGCVYVGGRTYSGDGTAASLLLIKHRLSRIGSDGGRVPLARCSRGQKDHRAVARTRIRAI